MYMEKKKPFGCIYVATALKYGSTHSLWRSLSFLHWWLQQ